MHKNLFFHPLIRSYKYWEIYLTTKKIRKRFEIFNQNELYLYNDEGSVIEIDRNGHKDLFFWDDNQRLMAVNNQTGFHHYFYDHTGQRVLKGTMRSVSCTPET